MLWVPRAPSGRCAATAIAGPAVARMRVGPCALGGAGVLASCWDQAYNIMNKAAGALRLQERSARIGQALARRARTGRA
jgi:hypothetical protein